MKKIVILILLILLILFLFTSTRANTFLVTNNNSSGTGSLAQAVIDANALTGQDTILFASTVRGTIYNDGVVQLTDGLVIIGPGPDLLTISADHKGRVIYIDYCYGKNFLFKGLTFKDGRSTSGGGAGICGVADTVQIINCVISNNESVYQNSGGGGIAVFTTGYLFIENCLISKNRSFVGGSGITLGSETIADIKNSSICNNTTTGNAVYGGGGIYCAGKLTLFNCTVSGNSHPARAGGVHVYGFLNMTNCTIANNFADTCGGIYNISASEADTAIVLCNTIVYGNTSNSESKDLYGRIYSKGYNLIGDIASANITGSTTGNIFATDPLLEELDTLSAIIQLHKLQTGSPAIDNGNNILCTSEDQRGILRPQDGNDDGIFTSDIGAFEFMIDSDDDGISNREEMGPDGDNSNYDGNGDGVADNSQSNITSLWNYNSEIYLTIAAPEGYKLINVVPSENPSESGLPAGVEFPVGFFKFIIDLQGSILPSSVMIYFPAGVSITDYYKYGSTTDLVLPHWYQFNYDSETGAEIILPDIVELNFIDGIRGDDDLTANGFVVDAGGPAGIITSVNGYDLNLNNFSLSQNYPNPFNPGTKIKFTIPKSSHVLLKLYDILGNEIATLVNEEQSMGEYELDFNADGISSGIYFYQLKVDNFIQTKKMILLK